jgi:hypothetical protein
MTNHIQMSHLKIYLFASLFLVVALCDANDDHGSTNAVRFTENKNQWAENILYKAQLDGGALFLEKNCFTYNFYDKETQLNNHLGRGAVVDNYKSHAFRMTFLNASRQTNIIAKKPTNDYCNYFIGKDETKWAGGVKNYAGLVYTNLYEHINLEVQGLQNSLKYNFIVAPMGNTTNIKMSYEGLKEIYLEKAP